MARAKKSAPKMVKERLGLRYFSVSDLEGSIDNAIKMLQAIKNEHPGKNLFLEYEQEPYEDSYSLNLYEIRHETAEETKKRKKLEAELKARIESAELAQLERLQKKFAKK